MNRTLLTILIMATLSAGGIANPVVIAAARECDCILTGTIMETGGKRIFAIDSIIKGEITKKVFETLQKQAALNGFKLNDKCLFVYNDRMHGTTIIEKNGDFNWHTDNKEQKFNVLELKKLFND